MRLRADRCPAACSKSSNPCCLCISNLELRGVGRLGEANDCTDRPPEGSSAAKDRLEARPSQGGRGPSVMNVYRPLAEITDGPGSGGDGAAGGHAC